MQSFPFSFTRSPKPSAPRQSASFMLVALMLSSLCVSANAQVQQQINMPFGVGWDQATDGGGNALWSDGLAPQSGFDYSNSGLTTRTTNISGGTSTFGGDTLTITGNGQLLTKGTASPTFVVDLILNNGQVTHGDGNQTHILGAAGSILIAAGGGTFSGPGSGNRTLRIDSPVSGSGNITVSGLTGSATVFNGNNSGYTGTITVASATLRAGASGSNWFGDPANSVIIQSAGTLDINARNLQAYTFDVAGTITNSGGAQNDALRNVNLTGNATFTGGARWDIRGAGTGVGQRGLFDMNGFTVDKTSGNIISLVNLDIANPGTINVNAGTLGLTRSLMAGGTINVNGATLFFENNNAGTFSYGMAINLNNATLSSSGANASTSGLLTLTGNNTFNQANTHTHSGGLAGSGNLLKTGAGVLLLSGNSSGYTGTITVQQGTLRAGTNAANNVFGSTANPVVIDGGTLDINNQNLQLYTFNVAGTITNTGGEQQNALRTVNLTGDTTFTGGGRWDIRAAGGVRGSLVMNGHTVTKTGGNIVSIVDTDVTGPGTINVNDGQLGMTRSTWLDGQVNVAGGAVLEFENNAPGNHNYQMDIDLADGATLRTRGGGATTVGSDIELTGNTTIDLVSSGASLSLPGDLTGSGGFTRTGDGNTTLVLTGTSDYQGPTIISSGTTNFNGQHRADGDVSVAAGADFNVNGLFGVGSDDNIPASISWNNDGSFNLNGTLELGLFAGGVSDQLAFDGSAPVDLGAGSVLSITDPGGILAATPSLTSYQLFTFDTMPTGSFADILLPDPGPGRFWDDSQLFTTGTLVLVPEPGRALLVAMALLTVLGRRRRA